MMMSTFVFQVEQTDILPAEIIFTLTRIPNHGHLVMLKNNSEDSGSPVLDYIQTFSQEDIDQSRVLYVSAPIQVNGHLFNFYFQM